MNRIIKIGMDVHSKTFTLCALEPNILGDNHIFGIVKVPADYREVVKFINALKKKLGPQDDYMIECGYKAGCLGYTLYDQLKAVGVKCVILAPTTMMTQNGKRVKTDARDAKLIAECLAYNKYNPVYVLTDEDEADKEFIRMRDSHKEQLKKVKQQIHAFCLRHVGRYAKTPWTSAHLKWLSSLKLSEKLRRVLDGYLTLYTMLTNMIEQFDGEIEELAEESGHSEDIRHLVCLRGIKKHTALAIFSEIGDLHRFRKGDIFAAFLGLAPGEHSSAEDINRTGISKAGNSHIRKLLIESAKGLCRDRVGYKSKALKARQAGNPVDILTYADRANIRLQQRYYHLIRKGKPVNVAVTAVARELACFIWGMTTGNFAPRAVGNKV